MKKLDKRTALRLLAKVVKEKGEDYRLPGSCVYFEQRNPLKPSCIVGYVFALWGDQEAIERLIANNSWSLGDGRFDDLPLTAGARKVLIVAQNVQDDYEPAWDAHPRYYKTWGEALKAARAV
jgi:hypothetical protein